MDSPFCYTVATMKRSLSYFKGLLKEKGVCTKRHYAYLREEYEQFQMMSAWSQIDDALSSNSNTVNPNNLIIPFLLGISSADPLSRRAIVPKKDGILDDAMVIVFEDETESPVHFRSHVKTDAGEIKPIRSVRPGDLFKGRKVFSVYPDSCEFQEVQSDKVVLTNGGIKVVPRRGEHIWFHTNEFPDIDVDFHPDDLEKVSAWCRERFGEDNVVEVCNYQRFGIRSSFKNISRVCDIPLSVVIKIADEFDDEVDKLDFDQILEHYPDFKAFADKNDTIIRAMKRMQGRVITFGTHASALIISSVPLPGRIPFITREIKGSDGRRKLSSWVEGQDRSDLSVFGFQKFDRLGLQTLANIQDCLSLLYERNVIDPEQGIFRMPDGSGFGRDWEDESYLNNPRSIAAAAEGNTLGCFQFESTGIRKLLRDMQVDDFIEMVIANAMYRPGVLKAVLKDGDGNTVNGGHELYCDVKKGKRRYEYPDILEPVLGETRGLMVFQEQVMRVLNIVGKIPLTDCEFVRKAISKKKMSIVNKYRDQFIHNASHTVGWSEEEASDFFDNNITVWSGYGFNKSHSLAYALIAMRTMYLKTHFPLEFFASFLSGIKKGGTKKNNTYEKIRSHIDDANRFDIDVIGVDVNHSKEQFSICADPNNPEREVLRFGFYRLKGIGTKPAAKIVAGQPYADFDDYLARGESNKKVVNALMNAGAFDSLPGCSNRASLVEYFEQWLAVKNKMGVGVQDYDRKFLAPWGLSPKDKKPVKEEFKEKLKELKCGRKMPFNTFVKFIYQRWGDIVPDSQIDEMLDHIEEGLEKPIWNDQKADFSSYQRMKMSSLVYGCLMPFVHPVRIYSKSKETHRISDFENMETHGESKAVFGTIDCYVLKVSSRKTKTDKDYLAIEIDDGYNTAMVRVWSDEIHQLHTHRTSMTPRELSHKDTTLCEDRMKRRVQRLKDVIRKHVLFKVRKEEKRAKSLGEEFDREERIKILTDQYTIKTGSDSFKVQEEKYKRIEDLKVDVRKTLRKRLVRLHVERNEYGFNLACVMNPVMPLRMSKEWTTYQTGDKNEQQSKTG